MIPVKGMTFRVTSLLTSTKLLQHYQNLKADKVRKLCSAYSKALPLGLFEMLKVFVKGICRAQPGHIAVWYGILLVQHERLESFTSTIMTWLWSWYRKCHFVALLGRSKLVDEMCWMATGNPVCGIFSRFVVWNSLGKLRSSLNHIVELCFWG